MPNLARSALVQFGRRSKQVGRVSLGWASEWLGLAVQRKASGSEAERLETSRALTFVHSGPKWVNIG